MKQVNVNDLPNGTKFVSNNDLFIIIEQAADSTTAKCISTESKYYYAFYNDLVWVDDNTQTYSQIGKIIIESR